jgi:UDP-N-acetylglucosamine acyltransferase
MTIHAMAVVHPKAVLADGVDIGPYAVIGENVTVAAGTTIGSHVVIEGRTDIGENCTISSFVSIGAPPQHRRYQGEDTMVIIGRNNTLREFVTVNRATEFGGGVTKIGDNNFLMAYVHIAHDCLLGNHILMANAATLAGHISIGDHAVIGGLVGIHQYVRIGRFAMVGGCSALGQDVPPFTRAAGGYRAYLLGLNSVGLSRNGFSSETIQRLKAAYKTLFRSDLKQAEAIQTLQDAAQDTAEVSELVQFIEGTKRGICRSGPPKVSSGDERAEELTAPL